MMQPGNRSKVWAALLPVAVVSITKNNMASIITIKHRLKRHIPTIRQDKDSRVNKVSRAEMNGRNLNRTMKTTTSSIEMLDIIRITKITTTKLVHNHTRVKINGNLSVNMGAVIPIK